MTGLFRFGRRLRIGVIVTAILYCIVTGWWLYEYWTYGSESLTRVKSLLGWVGLVPYVVGIIAIWLWPWGVGLVVVSYLETVAKYSAGTQNDKRTLSETRERMR